MEQQGQCKEAVVQVSTGRNYSGALSLRSGNNLLFLPSTKVLDEITGPEIRKRGAEKYLLLRCLILLQPWILQALSTPEPAPRNAWILGMPSSWKPFILMLTVSWLPSSSAWASAPPDILIAEGNNRLLPLFARLPQTRVHSEEVSC